MIAKWNGAIGSPFPGMRSRSSDQPIGSKLGRKFRGQTADDGLVA